MKTPMLNEIVSAALAKVEIMALNGDIGELLAEIDEVTTANCGWQAYGMARLIEQYAKYLQYLKGGAE